MIEKLKNDVGLRWPRALGFYQRQVASRLRGERRHIELSDWAAQGIGIVRDTGMHGIRFDRDGAWIEDAEGTLWAYMPGVYGSAMWAEFGMRWEEREVEVLAERLPASGVLVDIGANVGLYSVELARRLPELRVFAFEPVSITFEALQRNVERNGLAERVQARRMALTDEPGTLTLTKGFEVGNFVVPKGMAAAEQATEEVEARRLDEVLEPLTDRVDAIKCDVEGAELNVLRGARETLERDHPLLLVELDERWAQRYGHGASDVVSFLEQLGYGYERIVGDELLPASGSLERDLTEGNNYVFTAAGA